MNKPDFQANSVVVKYAFRIMAESPEALEKIMESVKANVIMEEMDTNICKVRYIGSDILLSR